MAMKACFPGTLQVLLLSLTIALCAGTARAKDDSVDRELARTFESVVRPFLDDYCLRCHGHEKPKAQFDLSPFRSVQDVVRNHAHWALVLQRLQASEMPPEESRNQPSNAERQKAIQWIQELLNREARRNAGDPGIVLARRLSNAEYDNTIRDLTGIDLCPTREFPVDPANPSGFDNSGESLTMSPALVKKYLQAARSVADRLVLKPHGFDFAAHPVLAETDRDKYSILRIVDFYQRQPTDLADYFFAAWKHKHRRALGTRRVRLPERALESKLSVSYLEAVWQALSEGKENVGPMATLRRRWQALPPPGAIPESEILESCRLLRDDVQKLRKKLAWKFDNLVLKGVSSGGQCFVMWKNRQYATHRRQLNPNSLEIGGIPNPKPPPARSRRANAEPPDPIKPSAPDPELFLPADETEQAPYLESYRRFCHLFPDAFYVSERGRMHIDDPNDKGRLLSAGFHNMMGYFRDDTPLMELILDNAGRAELDRLWTEFDFVAFVPERQHLEFIFYERAESKTMKGPEFDFARSEDKDATSEAKIRRLAEVYVANAKRSLATNGGSPGVIEVIEDHFQRTSANIRSIEKIRAAAEAVQIHSLRPFAQRAFRRKLPEAEWKSLEDSYWNLRRRDGLSHEEAMRDTISGILMSPYFCYRIDRVTTESLPSRPNSFDSETQGMSLPLDGESLANRLSYMLWASMPDEELFRLAESGALKRPGALAAQARRMMKDPKARGMALEFGGHWLDFRRFEEHNAVDRERFPQFNDHLRKSMFEEPIRFLEAMFRENHPVLDCLYGRYTYVNQALSDHYGFPSVTKRESSAKLLTPEPKKAGRHAARASVEAQGLPETNAWWRVDHADAAGRGGLLPMAVFLTQHSPGRRTSPVKRGYWVVRRVLGEQIPPPPPSVPELPSDESRLGQLSLRETLAKHREDKACSGCHARFDAFGLVFENYGPIGERRTHDGGGKPVDTLAIFPGEQSHAGLEGLREYLRRHREHDFLDNLSRKLLSYSLGRGILLSDEPLLQEMNRSMARHGFRWWNLVEKIVESPQFKNKRWTLDTTSAPSTTSVKP